MNIIYTEKEATEKKYTVNKAVDTALMLVREKTNHRVNELDTSLLNNINRDTKLTTVELNELVSKLVRTTLYKAPR